MTQLFMKCLLILTLCCNFIHPSLGLADQGAYFIRNVQDNLCITAGPIIGSENVSLFKGGIPISSNCTFGIDQEWLISGQDYSSKPTKYLMRSPFSQNLDRKLNAHIRGEFIIYFPNELQILSRLVNETRYYAIYDFASKICLESSGDNHVLHMTDCNFQTNPSQQWVFTLVNHARAAGTRCNSLWSCNQ